MRKAIFTAALVMPILAAVVARAADDCSLLAPSQIQKVVGQTFGEPEASKAPPAFGKQAWGTHCTYNSQKGMHTKVDFIIYADASAAEAKQTFDKLMMWFPAKSKPSGIGDSAYIDSSGAIHVLKGKVRFYIQTDSRNEKLVKDLATSVAGRI